MQTEQWYINRTNELAPLIDASEHFPAELVSEWEHCVRQLHKVHGYSDEALTEIVVCPANWVGGS